jgi:hypothetical protein
MQSKITINLNEYNDAINLSIHDDDWISLAYKQKDNILDFTREFCNKPNEAAAIFSTKPDISLIMKYKKSQINESSLNFFLEPFTETNKILILKNIKNKTKYIAENIALILHEYGDNTNNFLEGELKPFPDNIQNTTKPINLFKLENNGNQSLIKIINNKLFSDNKNINQYFEFRNNNKKIERAYTNINLEENIKELNFFKQTEIPTNLLLENGKYKVIFIENQSVKYINNYRTIDSRNFMVKNIMRSNES